MVWNGGMGEGACGADFCEYGEFGVVVGAVGVVCELKGES